MASNPMKRRTRASFVLGMFTALVLTGVVIAYLAIELKNKIEKEKAELAEMVQVYTLNQDVSSGQVVTTDMFSKQTVNRNLVPNNATSDISIFDNYSLQDKEGNNLYTINDGDEQKLCITKNKKEYIVKQEEETDNYYIINDNEEKEYLELDSVPLVAKVTMKRNTVITKELLSKADSIVQDDVRKQEYNILVLPSDLTTGDYIDVRLMLPNGQDYIVVAKKEVELPVIGGVESAETLWLNLTEDEILEMSCAIVDNAQIPGSKLYATKYTDAGMQAAATPTYAVNESTVKLLQSDVNILDRAKAKIASRYQKGNSAELRNNYINSEIDKQGEQAESNVQSKIDESISNQKSTRKSYLDSLSGAGTTSSSSSVE